MSETPYSLMRRTRDIYDGIVHLKDPMTGYMALCQSGFAASSVDMNIDNDAPPTCFWCLTDKISGFQHWRLVSDNDVRRQTIVRALPKGAEFPEHDRYTPTRLKL